MAMNWAWQQELKPVPKLILMALADAADDDGICWPSVRTVAIKASVSSRTVQRVMQMLAERKLLVAEPRYRGDGSCSSNRYRLLLRGGDNLSPAPDCSDTTPRHRCQGDPDRGVVPRTTIRTQREPPLPPAVKTKPSNRGGGKTFVLVFPQCLLRTERVQAQAMVKALNLPLTQQVLDEWSGIISAGAIRSSRLGCLRALIKRATEGTFAPERALQVAQARNVQQHVTLVQHTVPDLGPIDENNALAQRLMVLSKQAKGKNR